jgi:hypothetical protein
VCVAAYVFLTENSVAIGTAIGIGAEVTTGVPNPASAASFEGRVAGEAIHDVYMGMRNGKPVYVGITKDIATRSCQHGDRFDYLAKITPSQLTRDQARGIEQSVMNKNPNFENVNNSISPNRSWYDEAVTWGSQWLSNHGM